jgi:hypothetical protein
MLELRGPNATLFSKKKPSSVLYILNEKEVVCDSCLRVVAGPETLFQKVNGFLF